MELNSYVFIVVIINFMVQSVCVYEHTLTHIYITNHEGHFEGCSTDVRLFY